MKGDLWDLYEQGHHRIVITTNIGWDLQKPHRNNMGAGIALQAAMRHPKLPAWYGRTCRRLGADTPVLVYRHDPKLILFPVKPLLSYGAPERSWDQVASLELIEQGLRQLLALPGHIALSTPGAGNGMLDPAEVAELVREVLSTDRNPRRFVLVEYKPLELREVLGRAGFRIPELDPQVARDVEEHATRVRSFRLAEAVAEERQRRELAAFGPDVRELRITDPDLPERMAAHLGRLTAFEDATVDEIARAFDGPVIGTATVMDPPVHVRSPREPAVGFCGVRPLSEAQLGEEEDTTCPQCLELIEKGDYEYRVREAVLS